MKPAVLLADDDDGQRFPIKNVLIDSEFEVAEVTSQEECVKNADPAALWVIDVRLPSDRYEGILAVFELARAGIKSRYPVLFFSIHEEKFATEQLQGLKAAGVRYKWLMKPFEPEFLLDLIDDCIKEVPNEQ